MRRRDGGFLDYFEVDGVRCWNKELSVNDYGYPKVRSLWVQLLPKVA